MLLACLAIKALPQNTIPQRVQSHAPLPACGPFVSACTSLRRHSLHALPSPHRTCGSFVTATSASTSRPAPSTSHVRASPARLGSLSMREATSSTSWRRGAEEADLGGGGAAGGPGGQCGLVGGREEHQEQHDVVAPEGGGGGPGAGSRGGFRDRKTKQPVALGEAKALACKVKAEGGREGKAASWEGGRSIESNMTSWRWGRRQRQGRTFEGAGAH